MTYGSRSDPLTTLGVSMGLCLYASLTLLGLHGKVLTDAGNPISP